MILNSHSTDTRKMRLATTHTHIEPFTFRNPSCNCNYRKHPSFKARLVLLSGLSALVIVNSIARHLVPYYLNFTGLWQSPDEEAHLLAHTEDPDGRFVLDTPTPVQLVDKAGLLLSRVTTNDTGRYSIVVNSVDIKGTVTPNTQSAQVDIEGSIKQT